MAKDELLTVEQVAEYLQLTPRTVYSYIRAGRLPASKIGGKSWRINRKDIDKNFKENLNQ